MIKLEDLRKYCAARKGVEEDFPFDLSTLALKVCGKIFLLTDINAEVLSINLKCTPEHALHLRSRYPQITPGYHMNKKHWNTVVVDGSVSNALLKEWIDHSYSLVSPKSKKK